jgi:hypothetical protein
MAILREGKNKALNINKNYQLLNVSTDLKKFTTKDKKTIEYFRSQIINKVNNTCFNDMISKKKERLSMTVNQDDFNGIEFI